MPGKAHRGKTLWNLPSRGRGTCPVCNTARIKLLYTLARPDGVQIKVCKRCKNKKADNENSVLPKHA